MAAAMEISKIQMDRDGYTTVQVKYSGCRFSELALRMNPYNQWALSRMSARAWCNVLTPHILVHH
jgi:hypothetical protein